MKKLILLIIPILAVACKSSSYYDAMNTNKQRFDGWQEENATFLAETHDHIQLIEDLSELAQEKSKLRETYVLAQDIEEDMNNLKINYQIEATTHRIKLSSALSDPSDQVLHKLESISDENFDQVYLQFLKSELNELKQKTISYKKDGHNDRLKELADKVSNLIEDIEETNRLVS